MNEDDINKDFIRRHQRYLIRTELKDRINQYARWDYTAGYEHRMAAMEELLEKVIALVRELPVGSQKTGT